MTLNAVDVPPVRVLLPCKKLVCISLRHFGEQSHLSNGLLLTNAIVLVKSTSNNGILQIYHQMGNPRRNYRSRRVGLLIVLSIIISWFVESLFVIVLASQFPLVKPLERVLHLKTRRCENGLR